MRSGYRRAMDDLEGSIDQVATTTGFSGVVRVDRDGRLDVARAYGLAHRCCSVPNTVDTRFGIASGTKGLTALTVVSLIEEGLLTLATPARSGDNTSSHRGPTTCPDGLAIPGRAPVPEPLRSGASSRDLRGESGPGS